MSARMVADRLIQAPDPAAIGHRPPVDVGPVATTTDAAAVANSRTRPASIIDAPGPAVARTVMIGRQPLLSAADASAGDNQALLDLTASCEMRGDIGLRIDRAPDFFALNRLEGEHWRVGVVRGLDGRSVAGCVAVSERRVFVHGQPRQTMYLGDLKVHPAHRGGAVADALEEYSREACQVLGGPDVPCMLTILAGNTAMERRTPGPRGLPVLTRFATIRSHAIPLVWNRPETIAGVRVGTAGPDDIEEMAALWHRYGSARQFAPVHDPDSFARCIATAPGLGVDSYIVARDTTGCIVGFVVAWDQSSFKQLRVTSYSRRLTAVRIAFNAVARLGGATPLPEEGDELRCLTAYNLCVPDARVDVLRALLLHAYAAYRGRGYSCLNVGLDVRDPLCRALAGLLAQPTDVHAYVTTPSGSYSGAPLGGRLLHYETALV